MFRRQASSLALAVAVMAGSAAAQQAESPRALFDLGVKAFMEAKIADSVAAFDKLIALAPSAKPQLWQRGLALYYADEFAEGRDQFETHQTVNTADVENAAWHFLCVARLEGVEGARKHFIPIVGDSRVPMKEVHQLFAGTGSEEAVLKAASSGDDEERRNQLCYAHLYLGLYYEALKDTAKAKEHMLKDAHEYSMDHYMGKVAQVHLKVRGWDK